MRSSESHSTLIVCEKCRRIRFLVVILLVTSTVLAGYFWAHYEHHLTPSAAWGALVCIVFGLFLILAVEIVVTKVELEAKKLVLQMNVKGEEVKLLQENVRSLERNLDLLAKDDENVREQLRTLAFHQVTREEDK